jgi:predicted lipoprotein with Yx(FWY)xxD motif
MMSRAALGVAVATLALLVVVRVHSPPHRPLAARATALPSVTPPGITLQPRTPAGRTPITTAPDIVYADSRGMSLYVYDRDTEGRATCVDACAAGRPAAIAPAATVAQGDWAVLPRTHGTLQWTYRGAPLYTDAEDKAVGDVEGDGDEWHVATFRPGSGIPLPAGIAARENAATAGLGLVDTRGMTLYTLEIPAATGNMSVDARWTPLEAPEIASPTGDFAVLARDDGIAQWTFRGKPLYLFDGDLQPGEVNGRGTPFQVALIARLFMPADATVRQDVELGDILATADGATLYQRDRVTNEERHEFRLDHGSPSLGRRWGTATCDAECAKAWPPYAAPADALASGYWEVLRRPDGSRQWAYKGFALYRYAADKPGEVGGNRLYTLAQIAPDPASPEAGRAMPAGGMIPGIDPSIPLVAAAPGLGVGALFWHAVVP